MEKNWRKLENGEKLEKIAKIEEKLEKIKMEEKL